MQDRVFYQDPYVKRHTANVVKIEDTKAGIKVILDNTIFYPEGGGQPADTGFIDGIEVLDVYEEEGIVIHLLKETPKHKEVECSLNWQRRFDHMQQHAGQHILSAACEKLFDANTIGFHLSETYTTVDLDIEELSKQQLLDLEAEANRVVFANLPIKTHWLGPQELSNYPLRKPPTVDEDIRLVEVTAYDYSPCGGTHPQATGEVGLIKIIKTERVRQNVRLVFMCGYRALSDYQHKTAAINGIIELLSAPEEELVQATKRLLTQQHEKTRELRQAKEQMLHYLAIRLYNNAPVHKNVRIIANIFEDHDMAELKVLAAKLTKNHNTVALLATKKEKAQFIFARSEDVNAHMGNILKEALKAVEGRGGGSATNAQGGSNLVSGVEQAMQVGVGEVKKVL